MIIAVIAAVLAACALAFCVYLWLELQRRVSEGDIQTLLQSASDALNKESEKRIRSIETEWDDMYQKFSRLAGRMDRTKGLNTPQIPETHTEAAPSRRSDLIRKRKVTNE